MTVRDAQPALDVEQRPNDSLIRVLIQHPGVWDSSRLTQCLAPADGFLTVRYAGSPELVMPECNRMAPCVLVAEPKVLACLSPGTLGYRIAPKPAVHVLLVGPPQKDAVVEEWLSAGCAGFLPDSCELLTVTRAIRAVARGELWASRRMISRLLDRTLRRLDSSTLTARETEILQLIGKGLRNREIADRLYITRETVRWHIRSAYSKIGVSDRLSAALYATEYLRDGQRSLPGMARFESPALMNTSVHEYSSDR